MSNLTIHNLADVPKYISIVVSWLNEEWGTIKNESIDQTLAYLSRNTFENPGAFVLIALENGSPVGTASLVFDDMPTRPELSPWLADVYVVKTERKNGIGRKLVEAVEAEASRLTLSKIYLFTASNTALYELLGWQLLERAEYRGEQVRIMTKTLDAMSKREQGQR